MVQEKSREDEEVARTLEEHHQRKSHLQVGKRKLSLDSLSDFVKLKKINKRTLSVGSPRDFGAASQQQQSSSESDPVDEATAAATAAMVNGHHRELVKNGPTAEHEVSSFFFEKCVTWTLNFISRLLNF